MATYYFAANAYFHDQIRQGWQHHLERYAARSAALVY